MSLDEETLEAAASGDAMDLESWHGMVAPLLERLDYIVYNVFPMPRVPPSLFNRQPFPTPPTSSNSENPALANTTLTSPRPQATSTDSPPSSERGPDSQSQPSTRQSSETLPPPLALLLNAIRSSINSSFAEKPPHTIQRLAELILRPTVHYRTLPAYLRAVDRVISVTSSTDLFSFQMPASPTVQPNGLLHPGHNGGSYLVRDSHTHTFESDESLGGALLTPIPWLNNVSMEGEVANTLVPGVEEPIPTQPQNVEAISTTLIPTVPDNEESGAAATNSPPSDQSEELPHARGPPVLGVEDLGLQDGKGVEMALGEQATQDGGLQGDGAMDVQTAPAAPEASTGEEGQNSGEFAVTDQDGDIKLDDSNNPKEGEGDPAGEKNPESSAGGQQKK